jgi:hypothetical protein
MSPPICSRDLSGDLSIDSEILHPEGPTATNWMAILNSRRLIDSGVKRKNAAGTYVVAFTKSF